MKPIFISAFFLAALAAAPAHADWVRSDETPKTVGAMDITVNPTKYVGQALRVDRMVCYYADESDIRCTRPGSSFVIFATAVKPADADARLKKNCESFETMKLQNCLVSVVFKYTEDEWDTDTMGDGKKRIGVKPGEIRIVQGAKSGR